MRKPTIWVPTRSDLNWAVQSQKMIREEELYYPCSENKRADQLRSYCEDDLRLCFRLCRLLFSQAVAQLYTLLTTPFILLFYEGYIFYCFQYQG